MLIGGRANAALTRAARFGDGWLGVWTSPGRFAQVIADIEAQAEKLERPRPSSHGMQIWLGVDSNRDRARGRLAKAMQRFYQTPYERFERYAPYGDVAEVTDFLLQYRENGCELFNLMPVADSDAAGIDAVSEIAERLR